MSAAPHLRLVDQETGEIHDAPTSCPHCAEAQSECEIWERRVLQLERQVKRLTEDRDAKLRQDKHYPAALDLIDEWKRECGHPNASASDPKRVQLALSVVKRYKDEREKLSLVIQQAKHLAYRDPDTGLVYDQFGKIFGSSDEIEKRATHYYLARKRGLLPRGKATG
jgi:hypothetical protein